MNVGLIGIGKIGFYYDLKKEKIHSLAKAFLNSRFFNLKCVIDIDSKKLDKFKSNYNKVVTSSQLSDLKKYKPEILVISTPSQSHVELIKKILKFYKPNIILCEKPISYNFQHTASIIKLCNKKRIHFFVNYQRISNPIYEKLKKIVRSEKSSFNLKVIYSKGIYHNCSHYINLMIYLFGNNLTQDVTKKKKNKNDYEVNFNLNSKNFNATFKFGKTNSLSLRNKNLYFLDKPNDQKFIFKTKEIISKKKFNLYKDNYQMYVIKNLENFILKKKNILCNNEKALLTEKIINKIVN